MSYDMELYEGLEPYIFVSYSHKDKEKVLPIIEKLIQNDYRIWYDQGIHPGTEWPEIIAERLKNSAVFVVFLSKQYMQSKNCIREIHYAVANEKDFLSVILEPVELTAGVEMQLCVSQAVDCGKLKDDEKIQQEILSAEVLEQCRKIVIKEPEVAMKEEELEKSLKAIPVKATSAKKVSGKKKIKQKKKKNKKITCYALIFAVVLAVIGIGVNVYNRKQYRVNGEYYPKNTTTFWFTDEHITKQTMESLMRYPSVDVLEFEKCSFDSDAVELLSEFKEIFSFKMSSCTGVTDFSFLESYKSELNFLTLHDMKLENEDLQFKSELSGLNQIEITHNPDLTDVTQFLEGAPELLSIDLSNNNIGNLDVITEYQDLYKLHINDNKITSIKAPLESLRISELDVSNNPLVSVAGLKNLTVLEKVRLGNCLKNLESLDGLECLMNSKESLLSLDLSNNQLNQEQMETILNKGLKVQEINLSYNKLDNLDFLSGIDNTVEKISAEGCGLKDISAMNKWVNLCNVDLSDNEIESLDKFPLIQGESGMITLDLRNNKLNGISDLKIAEDVRFEDLFLSGNILQKEDADILKNFEGDTIAIPYIEGMPFDSVEGFYTQYIQGVPMTERVKYEDNLYGCIFGTPENDGSFTED